VENFGLLLTMTEPPPGAEAEFNAWYDGEHIAERLSISGFLSARRWEADVKPGEGRYLATYELVSPAVLQTPEYLSHVGDNLWYDQEHAPKLAQVPGVLRARRFRDPVGKPRYIALYDLHDETVIERPEWRAALQTKWAKRMDELTRDQEWILRLYRSYTPART
jgi:hypothetical protein